MPFHFCPDEMMMILGAIPFLGVVIAKVKSKVSR